MSSALQPVVVITGVSRGIGAGIAKELIKHGLKVIGISRSVPSDGSELTSQITLIRGSVTDSHTRNEAIKAIGMNPLKALILNAG